MARITGRDIQEEARTPSFDLIKSLIKTRATWLGHILRMDEECTIKKVARELYEKGEKIEGGILEMAPSTANFMELMEIANDRERWREHVKSIVDSLTPTTKVVNRGGYRGEEGSGGLRRSRRLRKRAAITSMV